MLPIHNFFDLSFWFKKFNMLGIIYKWLKGVNIVWILYEGVAVFINVYIKHSGLPYAKYIA